MLMGFEPFPGGRPERVVVEEIVLVLLLSVPELTQLLLYYA